MCLAPVRLVSVEYNQESIGLKVGLHVNLEYQGVRVKLYCSESERKSDVALGWIHSFPSCMLIMGSKKD